MTTVDYTALYREDATEDELVVLYQELVNNGQAWMLEGSVGRTAYDLIEQGVIMRGHRTDPALTIAAPSRGRRSRQ